MIDVAALLVSALLFGGMTLFSFGFAASLFASLPADIAGRAIRGAFPHFYLFVIVCAAVAALLLWPADPVSAGLMAVVSVTTVPARQTLMPAINAATDAGRRRRFQWLHGVSVAITLGHIALAGAALARLA